MMTSNMNTGKLPNTQQNFTKYSKEDRKHIIVTYHWNIVR